MWCEDIYETNCYTQAYMSAICEHHPPSESKTKIIINKWIMDNAHKSERSSFCSNIYNYIGTPSHICCATHRFLFSYILVITSVNLFTYLCLMVASVLLKQSNRKKIKAVIILAVITQGFVEDCDLSSSIQQRTQVCFFNIANIFW